MKNWAGLLKGGDKELMIQTVDAMYKTAVKLLAEKHPPAQQLQLLPAPTDEEEDEETA